MGLLSELTPLVYPVRHANGVYSYGAHRTHTAKLYEVTESFFDLSELKDELLEWEQVYNTVRPHQALGYVTPLKFLEQRTAVTAGDKNTLERRMCH
jgi:transposase InsO family protein